MTSDNLCVVGIDPGKGGGLSLIVHTPSAKQVTARPMPLRPDGLIDLSAVLEWSESRPKKSSLLIVIEKQQARRMQGVNRASVMMCEYGRLLGLFHGERIMQVMPKVWQASELPGCPPGATKDRSIASVRLRYPRLDLRRTPRCRKLHDGMSDAVLIAEYGLKNAQ